MANKREFPRDMSFVDRQSKVVHPSREDYLARTSSKVGKAYAFFDCRYSKGKIEGILPVIREYVQTPKTLELSLTEDPDVDLRTIAARASRTDSFKKEFDLVTKALQEGDKSYSPKLVRLNQRVTLGNKRGMGNLSGTRYCLEAKYKGATNHQTADEVASILNQAYQSPLYKEGEHFRGEVVYEDNGRYMFRE